MWISRTAGKVACQQRLLRALKREDPRRGCAFAAVTGHLDRFTHLDRLRK